MALCMCTAAKVRLAAGKSALLDSVIRLPNRRWLGQLRWGWGGGYGQGLMQLESANATTWEALMKKL